MPRYKEQIPKDIYNIALHIVKGYPRRKAWYSSTVGDIIHQSAENFSDHDVIKKIVTQSGVVEVKERQRVYNTCTPGGASSPTEVRAERIIMLEENPDVKLMRAVEQADNIIGLDIQDQTTRSTLVKAIHTNCIGGRLYPFERLAVDGISRSDFYRRKRDYLTTVAKAAGIL